MSMAAMGRVPAPEARINREWLALAACGAAAAIVLATQITVAGVDTCHSSIKS